ncbi:hypothetical protein GN958_ATG13625 [Phytophthora infestans]|uniref:Uncharacterized protein n=1 Tax=Phytophthora infestans TaxID=4787 RepID=A0A8S9UCD4_PHYIN|nr:hypothetical protein GN958_ATG13625 [Phytophthora infestans]
MSDREVRLLARKEASTREFSVLQLNQLVNSASSLRIIQRVLACVDVFQYTKMDNTWELTAEHKLDHREYAKAWLLSTKDVGSRMLF